MSSDGNIVQRVLAWLRAGYPEGVPQQDYVALFGVLHRALTPTEVESLAQRLAEGDTVPVGRDDIENLIRRTVHEEPSDADVRRVAGRLAAGGWPLERLEPVDA